MNTQLALAARGNRGLLAIFDTKNQALASTWLSVPELKALAERANLIVDLLTEPTKTEVIVMATCERCGGSFPIPEKGRARFCDNCRSNVKRENGKRQAAKALFHKDAPIAATAAIDEPACNDAPPSISVEELMREFPQETCTDSVQVSAPDPLDLAKQRNRATIERLRKRMAA